MTEIVLFYFRYPEAGKTKTRLIPALGAEGACRLSRKMTENVRDTVLELKRTDLNRFGLVDRSECIELAETWLGPRLSLRAQAEGDLGKRLKEGFHWAFSQGATRVLAIGSDCPDISVDILNQAFEELLENDAVLGPSYDGGYYLIGLSRFEPGVFRGISWSTEQVSSQTINFFKANHLSYFVLPRLRDIDTADDLPYLGSLDKFGL